MPDPPTDPVDPDVQTRVKRTPEQVRAARDARAPRVTIRAPPAKAGSRAAGAAPRSAPPARTPRAARPAAVGAPSGPIVIETRRLEKTYPNGTRAVLGVSFAVSKGEVFGILGPNGAGKSTIIGILGTLVRPTGGAAFVDGIDVTSDTLAVRRRIGFAMQEAGVDELARGREFLVLQGRLYGLRRKVAEQRAVELLQLFELEEAAGKLVGGYSGGMKRRIDLAAALIHRPPILFLDEPTEGLDPRSRRKLWDALRRLNKEQGSTVLLSTHYMDEADALCDRIAILDRGEIVAVGTPAELKASVGGQSIAMRFPDGDAAVLTAAEAALSALDAIDRVQRTDAELIAYVPDAGAATPGILRALDHAGCAPQSLRIQQPTLDDVYLRYTGRTLQAAEGAASRSAPSAASGGAA